MHDRFASMMKRSPDSLVTDSYMMSYRGDGTQFPIQTNDAVVLWSRVVAAITSRPLAIGTAKGLQLASFLGRGASYQPCEHHDIAATVYDDVPPRSMAWIDW